MSKESSERVSERANIQKQHAQLVHEGAPLRLHISDLSWRSQDFQPHVINKAGKVGKITSDLF